ncbi:MAG: hypothetical protein OZ923_06460 [Comamonadaceae bacterium]|nr:hypothetical protein [Comamonadaceae bacterium]
MPELFQPLMVVVLVVGAHAAALARMAGVFVRRNGQARCMAGILEDAARMRTPRLPGTRVSAAR